MLVSTSYIDSLKEELATQLGKLTAALKMAHEADEAALVAKSRIERARAQVLITYAEDPKRLGGNEAAREAKIAEITASEGDRLREADKDARTHRLGLELARIEHQYTRDRIRLAEVAVGIVRNH